MHLACFSPFPHLTEAKKKRFGWSYKSGWRQYRWWSGHLPLFSFPALIYTSWWHSVSIWGISLLHCVSGGITCRKQISASHNRKLRGPWKDTLWISELKFKAHCIAGKTDLVVLVKQHFQRRKWTSTCHLSLLIFLFIAIFRADTSKQHPSSECIAWQYEVCTRCSNFCY